LNIFHSIQEFIPNTKVTTKRTILTLGTFDGVHIGHKKILEKLTKKTTDDSESLVLTFFPHPRMVLEDNSEIKLLNTLSEKIELLKKSGLENLVIHPFDERFSQLTAQEFVKTVLVDQFKIQKIIIGHDHRFGKNRTANFDDLVAFGKQYEFEVEKISAQEIESVSVSSTKIRKALDEGNMKMANEYLGYDYFLTGMIIKGKQLGRTIGFPTANLKIEGDYKLIPRNGVYIVKSELNRKTVFGIMNIGLNPTVEGQNLSIEIHYLDYNDDLYGQEICVSIIHFIRAEEHFASIPLLKEQLEKDKNTALHFLKKIENN
jgi:riboflavin kinase / FMN adenylyltransferase